MIFYDLDRLVRQPRDLEVLESRCRRAAGVGTAHADGPCGGA
nr:hypothetical protein [Streptomyces inhibens]